MKSGVTKHCLVCNSKFYRPNCRDKGSKYCSKSCLGKGRKGITFSIQAKKNMSLSHVGVPHSLERKRKLSISQKARREKHWQWKGGISDDKRYRDWQKNQWHHRNRKAIGEHSFREWETLKCQYNWTCPSCHKCEPDIKLTLDHIIPLSKGGSNNIENIQPLCKSCNCKKSAKSTKY